MREAVKQAVCQEFVARAAGMSEAWLLSDMKEAAVSGLKSLL
jgi:hypothetical protein